MDPFLQQQASALRDRRAQFQRLRVTASDCLNLVSPCPPFGVNLTTPRGSAGRGICPARRRCRAACATSQIFPPRGRRPRRHQPLPTVDAGARPGRRQQQPVWADDPGLRILARGLGIPAVSTPAVLDVLPAHDLLTSREHSDAIEAMFRAKVGDFEITDQQFLDTAQAEEWDPDGAAAVALGRPAAWRDLTASLRRMRSLMRAIRQYRPDLLHWWLYWCVSGAAFTTLADPRRACTLRFAGWHWRRSSPAATRSSIPCLPPYRCCSGSTPVWYLARSPYRTCSPSLPISMVWNPPRRGLYRPIPERLRVDLR